jgi:hypothetical protein
MFSLSPCAHSRHPRVGIKMPTIEVRFEHMKIKAEVHVGKRASPTLTNYVLDMVEVSNNIEHLQFTACQYLIYLWRNSDILISLSFLFWYFKGSIKLYTKKKKTTSEHSQEC